MDPLEKLLSTNRKETTVADYKEYIHFTKFTELYQFRKTWLSSFTNVQSKLQRQQIRIITQQLGIDKL